MRWGERGLSFMLGKKPDAAQRIARVKRLSHRYGPVAVVFSYVLPIPNAMIDAAAGIGGMRLRVFLVCDVIAGLLWTGLLAALGYATGQHAVDAVRAVAHYALVITVVLVVAVIARQVAAARRSR